MRIQHNIMAMNAYRNYTNNVSAMKSNLEKLSSGYKINRAGDDAAGLAISEKMRAQITGLETAQKNAKDGISLVQTAEGALTEVHDMLNRMVELATQSANGTYDNETDRNQLQKEVDQLKSEINRIADSANFNGIKLLDGSMAAAAAIEGTPGSTEVLNGDKLFTGMDRILESVIAKDEQAWEVAGDKSILDGAGAVATSAKFEVDLKTLEFEGATVYKASAAGTVGKITVTIGTVNGGTTTASLAIKGSLAGIKGNLFQVGGTFTVNGTGSLAGAEFEVTVLSNGSLAVKMTKDPTSLGTNGVRIESVSIGSSGFAVASKVAIKEIVTVKVGDKELSTNSKGFSISSAAMSSSASIAKVIASQIAKNNSVIELNGMKWTVKASGTKLKFEQIKKPETADQARANFDVSISIKTGDGASVSKRDDFKIQLKAPDKVTVGDGVGSAGEMSMSASIKAGTHVTQVGVAKTDANKANTVFNIQQSDIVDGTKIAIGTRTITLAVGPNSKVLDSNSLEHVATKANGCNGYVQINEGDDLNTALSKISKALGSSVNFLILDKNGDEQQVKFQIGVSDGKQGFPAGLTVQRVTAYSNATTATGGSACAFNSLEKLAANFKLKVHHDNYTIEKPGTDGTAAKRGLVLQIGDTADKYNQLEVSIEDMHTKALGLDDMKISDQESAAAAVDKIKAAINQVSDLRGTLGATQNRLDHTINNLSVMTENIQDAESTIRDTDVADEMMAYTKNNILIQSAQAMLAQANQVPQGVLQLLQ